MQRCTQHACEKAHTSSCSPNPQPPAPPTQVGPGPLFHEARRGAGPLQDVQRAQRDRRHQERVQPPAVPAVRPRDLLWVWERLFATVGCRAASLFINHTRSSVIMRDPLPNRRRCVVLINGFYEWKTNPNNTKQVSGVGRGGVGWGGVGWRAEARVC